MLLDRSGIIINLPGIIDEFIKLIIDILAWFSPILAYHHFSKSEKVNLVDEI